jgi:hypothetical protein
MLHPMISEHLGEDDHADAVVIGIETDRGLWVQALIGAGVFAITRCRWPGSGNATDFAGRGPRAPPERVWCGTDASGSVVIGPVACPSRTTPWSTSIYVDHRPST